MYEANSDDFKLKFDKFSEARPYQKSDPEKL